MKKLSAKFYFEKTYILMGEMREAIIELTINYQTQSFSITPLRGEKFSFINASQNFELWKAVTASINEAIDFATKELGLVDSDPIPHNDILKMFVTSFGFDDRLQDKFVSANILTIQNLLDWWNGNNRTHIMSTTKSERKEIAVFFKERKITIKKTFE